MYRIVWSGKTGQGEQTAINAAMADAWVDEFRDKGADAIAVFRDGAFVDLSDLPDLIKQETARSQEARDAQGS